MSLLNINENFNFGLGMSGVDSSNPHFQPSGGNTRDTYYRDFWKYRKGIDVASTGATGTPFVAASSNLNFIHCSINNIVANDSVYGIFIDSVGGPTNTNILIDHVQINHLTQTDVIPPSNTFAPFCKGIDIAGAISVVIRNCDVDDIIGSASTDSLFPI